MYGSNNGQLNPTNEIAGNQKFVSTLNDLLTRQFRCAFLVEEPADPLNRVELSTTHRDNLGLFRPEITYKLSPYVMAGFRQARIAATEYMRRLGATEMTAFDPRSGTKFSFEGQNYNYAGAGHVCGTHIMGPDLQASVVDSWQRSWDHNNLYVVGCGSMPSIGTQNPTLTMVAMADRTVQQLLQRL